MSVKHLRAISVLVLAGLGLAACGGGVHSGGVYDRRQAGEAQYVSHGTIVAMREVQIAGERSGLGTIGGGVLGGVGGSMIGKGRTATIAGTAGGAILGAVLGSVAEKQLTKTTATEFMVREDTGQTLAVVQANDERLVPGERVVVLRGSRARVVRDMTPPASGAPTVVPPPAVGAPPPTPFPPQPREPVTQSPVPSDARAPSLRG